MNRPALDSLPDRLPSVSVLIPTWRRPASLLVCVRAIAIQSRRVDQVVITVRSDDPETHEILETLRGALGAALRVVEIPPVNLRDAMNAGLLETTGDLVALTDDDVEPHADWIEKLVAAFTAPEIGGVGGRDWQPIERGNHPVVGTLSWYGRGTGNHHLGCGPARDVELLKGANCCFRGDLLRSIGFDRRLRGKGNVSHWEMSLCFAVRRAGYRLIYDPAIAVDHHIAARQDGDTNARGGFERESYIDAAHNESVAMLTHLRGARRAVFCAWRLLIGTIGSPGLVQVVRRALLKREGFARAWERFSATRAGYRLANQTLRSGANA